MADLLYIRVTGLSTFSTHYKNPPHNLHLLFLYSEPHSHTREREYARLKRIDRIFTAYVNYHCHFTLLTRYKSIKKRLPLGSSGGGGGITLLW